MAPDRKTISRGALAASSEDKVSGGRLPADEQRPRLLQMHRTLSPPSPRSRTDGLSAPEENCSLCGQLKGIEATGPGFDRARGQLFLQRPKPRIIQQGR